jgi:hypothetical protein
MWLGIALVGFGLFQLLTGGAWVAFLILGVLMLVLSRAQLRSGGNA